MRLFKNMEPILNRYMTSFPIWPDLYGKRILITGGKGTIGTALIHLLLAANSEYKLNLHLYVSTRNPDSIPVYVETSDPIEWIRNGTEEETLFDKEIDYIIWVSALVSRPQEIVLCPEKWTGTVVE